ncbi:hypothetical protein HWV62_27951 [Athelia sp. TMB]|nr:hypothetical protein HWV62_27951 [Athelia sp. TMB]
MPKSEIDDIFASKGKGKPLEPTASPSLTTQDKKRKKKKKKQVVDFPEQPVSDAKSTTKKRAAPETVIDPSIQVASVKRAKKEPSKRNPANDIAKEAEESFKDSRGSGPRRKTEEGFSIFKEAELGIRDEGGGEIDVAELAYK